MKLSRPAWTLASSAFSLIEIVLAVGIISFALVGILGMFPIALDAAAASRNETQAAFIVKELVAGLVSQSPFLPANSSAKSGDSIDLATPGAPKTFYFDQDGVAVASVSQGTFEAEVKFTADVPSPGLTRVDVIIIVPAGRKNSPGASEYPFFTVVRQRDAVPNPAPMSP